MHAEVDSESLNSDLGPGDTLASDFEQSSSALIAGCLGSCGVEEFGFCSCGPLLPCGGWRAEIGFPMSATVRIDEILKGVDGEAFGLAGSPA